MQITAVDDCDTGPGSASELRSLIDKNADGILVVDTDGTVLFCNQASAELFGRSTIELTGTPIGVPMAVAERAEISVHRRDGSCVEIEMRVVECSWKGTPALLASLRDISERRQLEEQLRQSQKLEAAGRLMAGVAHDFNNLLTIVLGNLEVAQRRLGDDRDHPRLAGTLANAMEGARRAATLTHQLLAFARKQPLSPKSIHPNALIRGMTELLGRTLGEAIRIETRLAENLWPILIDATQLESAIINLAVNARDAMAGWGTLTIETSRCEGADVERGTVKGEFVCISITDTGSGIPDEISPYVFEPFFTTKGVGHGTGLGLSQVYGFVKQSGGYVTLESQREVGTTFRLYLPRHLPAPSVHVPSRAALAGRQCGKVLLVEDEAAVRTYARELLADFGLEVMEAADATEAMRVLETEGELHLMLSDIGLPGGVDGRELARKARSVRSSLQIVLTSACAGERCLSDSEQLAGFGFLPKPYSRETLKAAIDRLFRPWASARILLVEDDPLVRSTLVQPLVEAGCQVVEAGTATEAMAIVEEAAGFSAAIVDIGLPDGTGDAIVTAVNARWPATPVLVVTGYADEGVHARYRNGGRTTILEKPFENGQLHELLRSLGVLPN